MGTQTATILVTDLVGSTALRGEVGEERAEALRRSHDRALVEAARANGGTVVKGLGDGVLVMFAGAAEAVAAAVAMQRAVDLLARSERLPLSIRVGVSAGDVTLEDGDCFGAPVVEASRLCAAADGGQVLVAEVVRVLARGRGGHEMTPVGELELKGLAEPVPTFDVAWEPAAGAADLRTRTPYVGREREREVLAGRIAAARDGTGGLVLVCGEPGIGKTRLTNEVCSDFDDVITLFGGCHDGDVVPYAPFAEAVTEWVRRSPVDAVRSTLGPDASVVARLAPAIHEILSEVGEPLAVPADAETARLHDAMGQVLTRLAAEAPIVLVVDDLHWADEATVGMLRAVARVAGRTRLLVVGTYRETDLDRRHPFAAALPLIQREVEPTRIALDGLRADDVRALLERLSGHDVPAEFATLLATETDGNPFFLRETLLHLVDEGRLREVDGVWVAAPGDLGIPAGVRDVIGRRLSRLSPDANKLLAAGALFEVAFPLAVVATVTKIDEDDALDAVDEALDARIVAASGEFDHYAFTHALFRHTLVEELNPSRQVRMHRAIAEAIEKDVRGVPDPVTAATLARHFLRSAAIPGAERGVPYALAVADDAAARFARHEELSALRTAMELLDPGDERERDLLGRTARAALLARVDGDQVFELATAAAARLAADSGDDLAADFVAQLVRDAYGIDAVALRWRLGALGRRYLRDDRRDASWAWVRDSELERRDHEDATTPGIPLDDADARELRAALTTLRDDDRGISRYDTPATRAEALEWTARLTAAAGMWCSGEWAAGVPRLDEAVARYRAEGLVATEALALVVRSRLLMVLGRFDDAARDLDAAMALLPRLDPESNQTFQVLATTFLNDDVAGVSIGDDAADLLLGFAGRPDTQWAGLAIRMAVARSFARDRRRPDAARALLADALPAVTRAAPWAPNAPLVYQHAVDVPWRLAEPLHVDDLTHVVADVWMPTDLRYPSTDARLSLAKLRALAGDPDDARHWFDEARRSLTEERAEPILVAVDHDAAEMELRLGAKGDRERCATAIATARARCTHAAMAAWLPRLDALGARAAEVWPA
jgi:class 3 adenylate cyclase